MFVVFLHYFSKPDMKTWLVVPEGEEIIHPGDYTHISPKIKIILLNY